MFFRYLQSNLQSAKFGGITLLIWICMQRIVMGMASLGKLIEYVG
jgi:hypothetical protein